jgi:hypothetical protein
VVVAVSEEHKMQGFINLSNEEEAKLAERANEEGKLTVELARDLIVAGLATV